MLAFVSFRRSSNCPKTKSITRSKQSTSAPKRPFLGGLSVMRARGGRKASWIRWLKNSKDGQDNHTSIIEPRFLFGEEVFSNLRHRTLAQRSSSQMPN